MWSHLKSILELGVAQIKIHFIHAWDFKRISKNILKSILKPFFVCLNLLEKNMKEGIALLG